MNRYIGLCLILLTVVACSRREPTPSSQPLPTLAATSVPVRSATPTPEGSPVPRITIVPSATRLQTAVQETPEEIAPAPTDTFARLPTPTPSFTPTPQLVDAGATDTPSPTATVPESPLFNSPLAAPSLTPLPVIASPRATSPVTMPASSPTPGEPTDTPVPTFSAGPSSTPTFTATSPPSVAVWGFERSFSYYDEQFLEFYIWGEVVNNTESYQRITSLTPIVNDADGNPVSSVDRFESPWGYDRLIQTLSLAPGQSLAFSFLVFLPEEISVEDNYQVLVEAEPAEATRQDLEICQDDFDTSDWPYFVHVDGTYENPGPDLSEYVAVVVTTYDEANYVLGVGWLYETDSSYLTTGEHDFEITVGLWDIVDYLEFAMYSYKVQLFGR